VRSRGRRWLIAHAVLVGVLLVVFAALALAHDPDDGANIGAGIALLPILALGLPWSVPAWLDPDAVRGLGPVLWSVLALGPAVLNVGLHAAVRGLLRRRSR
jgi:hypothetical protein